MHAHLLRPRRVALEAIQQILRRDEILRSLLQTGVSDLLRHDDGLAENVFKVTLLASGPFAGVCLGFIARRTLRFLRLLGSRGGGGTRLHSPFWSLNNTLDYVH